MSNKINGPGPGVPQPPASRPGAAEHRNEAGQSRVARNDAPEDSARVRVTDTALRMKRLEEKILRMPPVDDSRVQEVREKLASGRFEISGSRIADKLILFEKDIE